MLIVPPKRTLSRSPSSIPSGPSALDPPKSLSSTSERTYKRSPMMAACAFWADGGSCLARTVKMYDAASAAVRLAKTGPDWLPRDCTAARPLSASGAVSGCQPLFTDVAVSTVVVLVLVVGTRAYQYQIATQMAMMIK